MSSKPSVATNTVLAPLPSSSALVAAVVPCANVSTPSADSPAFSSTALTASSTPSDWSSGVVGAFAVTSRPPTASTASVKVPPTSTPRSMMGGDGIYLGGKLNVLGLGEVLVGRAVAVVRQRRALARRAAARGGAALEALGDRVGREVLACEGHVGVADLVDPQLRRHREVD